MEEITKRIGISAIVIILALIFGIFIAKSIDSGVNSYVTNSRDLVPGIPLDISVTSQIVKDMGDKCRYFFDIRNNDNSSFSGSITIELYNELGRRVWYETFETSSPIESNTGKSVYTDANTCPTSIHGEYGISTYKFEVEVGNRIVKTEEGRITSSFED